MRIGYARVSSLQSEVLSALERPGVYLSYEFGKQWRVSGVPKRSNGVNLDWLIPQRTVNCLERDGLIRSDKRQYDSQLQVGYFLVAK